MTPPGAYNAAVSGGHAASAFFLDENRAWVTFAPRQPTGVSGDVVVWYTTDGAKNWQKSSVLDLGATFDFFIPGQITFVDAQHGWLLAHIGAGMMKDYIDLFSTKDGGKTWQRVVDPAKANLGMGCTKNGIGFLNATTGWIAGNCNGVQALLYLYKTTDGGNTWKQVTLSAPSGEPSNLFTSDQYVCGAYPPVFTTSKDGNLLVSCNPFDPAKAKAWLYVTADGGATWTPYALPAGAGQWQFIRPDFGWFVGGGYIYQSKDGGKKWSPATKVTWDGQTDFVDTETGWLVARTGTAVALVKSVNGGGTWGLMDPQLTP